MKSKTRQSKNEESGSESWKSLVTGFVGNIMERVSDNVTAHVQAWTKQMKRRAAGSIVMVLGATYLLTGLSIYADATLGKNIPGIGYMLIGLVSISIGYLVSRK